MTIRDSVRGWIINLLDLQEISNPVERKRVERLAELRSYYDGVHKEQLKVKAGKYNDNLAVNFCGLIVDKSVSALVGDPEDGRGLSWTFPSESGETVPASIVWLNAQWEANKKYIFLHKNALSGAESGYPCIKIIPDGYGNLRLLNMNPMLLTVETDEQDAEKVEEYCIKYSITEDGKTVSYREETSRQDNGTWLVETKRQSGGKFELQKSILWLYPFPPILDWQNLPVTDSPYGRSDIEGIIPIQDRYNFLVSNISKIIRIFAHPMRYGRNLNAQMDENGFKSGPDDLTLFNGDGEIVQLPPVGDLPGAMQFLQSLRESAFSLSREIDTQSMKDKVGAITNFALKVLYRDFLDKLGTKRLLYGAAYQELNRRMLVLGGYEPETCVIQWPDPLPQNEVEETSALTSDLNNKLVSIRTAQEARGYDPEVESERMAEESTASANVGSSLLNEFLKTGRNGSQ
jgi:hypothetical protein